MFDADFVNEPPCVRLVRRVILRWPIKDSLEDLDTCTPRLNVSIVCHSREDATFLEECSERAMFTGGPSTLRAEATVKRKESTVNASSVVFTIALSSILSFNGRKRVSTDSSMKSWRQRKIISDRLKMIGNSIGGFEFEGFVSRMEWCEWNGGDVLVVNSNSFSTSLSKNVFRRTDYRRQDSWTVYNSF